MASSKLRRISCLFVMFVFLHSGHGEFDSTILTTSMRYEYSSIYETERVESLISSSFVASSLDLEKVQKTLLPSYTLLELQTTATPYSLFSLHSSAEEFHASYMTETHTFLPVVSSKSFDDMESSKSVIENSFFTRSVNDVSSRVNQNYSDGYNVNPEEQTNSTVAKSKTTRAIIETSPYPHFHTPLMSLLVASSSLSFQLEESSLQTSVYYSSTPHQTSRTLDNESTNLETYTVPADIDHKKLLMLVLRSEDCTRLSKADFEKMLGKLMAKFGFGDVVPEVSNARCYSHLNINFTVGSATPTLRFLPNIDGRNNVTVDILNRTFRIVKMEKVDLRYEKSKSSNSTSTIIAKIAKHESVAYIAVGVSFGLVLVICVSVCCIKCCCLRKTQKRFTAGAKCTHIRLRPEDYTLTPIPRPTSLYVDYYRGSVTADIYSTTSAGSIASTTPTVEQGIIQPFDTSIVPLEDTATLPIDSSRDPSIESVPVQTDMKTFNIQNFASKGLRNTATDSKEQLNPKQCSRRIDSKASGVANPTFQRY